jgi:catechol 2,3-dioxygenase-like lactoylglutathione lyase family enzyme
MEINGIAHIQLTVSDFEACARFYGALMELFEMALVFDDGDVMGGWPHRGRDHPVR